MLKSMTGFGSAQGNISGLGKATCELRSINHRFLEILFHLPEGFAYLEEEIKKEIEKKIKRGRVTCLLKLAPASKEKTQLNAKLLRAYFLELEKMRKDLKLEAPVDLGILVHLPGVVSGEVKAQVNHAWPSLKKLVARSVDEIVVARAKEGAALSGDLQKRSQKLKKVVNFIRLRFGRIIKEKAASIKSLEERSAFLKSSDISEELTRVQFHLNNFTRRIKKAGPIGKELDFIAQELQRETNTIGAKSVDAVISGNVVAMKSEIEKIREQLQNVE